MVLGLKAKNRKNSLQVDYLIHIQEIKPWPPSQSLRTLRAALIQWEHGDRSSGSTKQVVPSLGTGSSVGDGRIEFNESFRLPVTLLRELSAKGGNGETFQKNCIEFNLYESRRDKTVKGLLGTALVDLADYAVVKEAIGISAPINCKRTYGNASQPVLYLKIQSVEKRPMSSSSKDSPTTEASLDRNGVDSVSALMSEEYAEEAETSSFTDDDVSSHSSSAVSSPALESNGGSPLQNKESKLEEMKTGTEQAEDVCSPALEQQLVKADDKQFATTNSSSKGTSSRSSSIDLTSDMAWITKKIGAHGNKFSSSPVMHEATGKEISHIRTGTSYADVPFDIGENVSDNGSNDTLNCMKETNEAIISSSDSNVKGDESLDSRVDGDDDDNATVANKKASYKSDFTKNVSAEIDKYEKCKENGKQREIMDEKGQCIEDESMDSSMGFDLRTQDSLESDAFSASRDRLAIQSSTQNIDRHGNKQVKSVRSPIESHRSNGLVRANPLTLGETKSCLPGLISSERKDNKVHPKETRNIISDSKMKQLEQRIKNLETELREAAAIEAGLYAVVAEHGSSTNKVHAPARRLSRFYLHASKAKSQSQRGSAAKSAISGLVLVAKACGNDVPRLYQQKGRVKRRMATAEGSDLSSEMEVDAFRRLFPLRFHERHLVESIRPDSRRLGKARDTTIALGAVTSANGSALTKIGCTTMLAAIKLEVMTPKLESPDEGCIAVDFHMPPICSPTVRPGRPAEAAPVVAKQLSDVIMSSGMIDLKDLSLVSGKAAWMAYLDIYCLDADGSLFDAALLSAVAAFSHLQIPVVSLSDEGRIVLVPEDNGEGNMEKDPVNKEKRKLKLCTMPFSLTCILHKNYILADPTAEEESIMETQLTVVLDSSGLLVSLYKPGGSVLAHTSAIQDCVALTRQRMKEVQTILNEAISDMEVD